LEVPVWAWVNLLAHGSEDELRAVRDAPPRLWSDEWQQARRLLAAEVLLLAEELGTLREVQDKVLIPMELSLAASRDAATWRPRQLATAGVEAVHEYRERCRHERTRRERSATPTRAFTGAEPTGILAAGRLLGSAQADPPEPAAT
jgi:hypothetical protein